MRLDEINNNLKLIIIQKHTHIYNEMKKSGVHQRPFNNSTSSFIHSHNANNNAKKLHKRHQTVHEKFCQQNL